MRMLEYVDGKYATRPPFREGPPLKQDITRSCTYRWAAHQEWCRGSMQNVRRTIWNIVQPPRAHGVLVSLGNGKVNGAGIERIVYTVMM